MVELEFKLTVNTAAMGIAAFIKTESRKETEISQNLFKHPFVFIKPIQNHQLDRLK